MRVISVVLLIIGFLCVQQARSQRFPLLWDGSASCSAMAFDAVASNNVASGSSLSWTHTPVGKATAVAVGFQIFGAANATSTSVTYGGVSMVQAATPGIDGNTSIVEMFGLASPPAGAQTVSITDTNTSGLFINAGSITVTCSSTSTTFDSANSAKANTGSPSVAVTSVSGEIVVDVLGGNTTGNPYSPTGSGQVQKWGPLTSSGDVGMGSVSTATGASTTMSWSITATSAWGIAAASFKHQ